MKLPNITFCVLLNFLILYPLITHCEMIITKQAIINEIGKPGWSKVCKVENGNIYFASCFWFTDTTELKLFMLDENLNLKKYKTKSLDKGFHLDIYANEYYIEYYGVINGGDNYDWWYDFHFRIERFDYDFNNIFSHEDTTDNLIRWNINRFPRRYRKSDGSYICYDNYILGSSEKLGFFATLYDKNGKFVKEIMFDTINFHRRIKLCQFFGKDERFYHYVRTPDDSLLPEDLYFLKIYSSTFDSVLFSGRIPFVEFFWPEYIKYDTFIVLFETGVYPGKYNAKLVMLDENGNITEKKEYSFDSNYDWYIFKGIVLSDGGFLFGGKRLDKTTKKWTMFLWKVNRNFETEDMLVFNEHSYGSSSSLEDLYELENGEVIVVARIIDKLWVGILSGVLGVENPIEMFVGKIKIISLDPNQSLYRFDISSFESPCYLKIYNVIGREVWGSECSQPNVFLNGDTSNWVMDVELKNLESGVYFFVVQSDKEKAIDKFIIIK